MNIFQASVGGQPKKKLFIINGESNSGGYALNSEALSSELLPRPAVQILDNTALLTFQDLDIGTNNLIGHSGLSNGSTHGFELELANRAELRHFYKEPCYLVKTGQGGSMISQWAIGQSFWNIFVDRVEAAQDLLSAVDYDPYILFSLGINDAIAGTNVNTWKAATIVHLANMRTLVGANTPIVMTQFNGMGGGSTYDSYSDAIQEICDELVGVYCVPATGAGLRDTNHWNYSGMKLMSGRMLDIIESI